MELDVVVDVVAMEAQHHSRIISIPASAQAAGAVNVVWQVPASTRWRVRSVFLIFATSAVVANRAVVLNVFDQTGNLVGQYVPVTSQVASVTQSYTFAYGSVLDQINRGNATATPIPLLELPEGWSISLTAFNVDVADQVSGAIIVVDAIPSRTVPYVDRATFEQL